MSKKWFEESLYQEYEDRIGYKQSILVEKEILDTKSKFQDIKIFKNAILGKVLVLDGVVQTTEADEFFYHEMFSHFPLLTHKGAKRVLIIGAGDGGILREVLKHKEVEEADMIEIDGDVIKYSKEYMPSLSKGAFENPRANVMVADGIDFVKNTEEKFDIIIVDSTDPISVGEILFTDEFYKNAKRCLNEGGILTTQSGVPFFQADELKSIQNKLSKIFNFVSFYIVPVPTYVGSFMCLSFASDNKDYFNISYEDIKERFKNSKLEDLKYYNPEIHMASMALPEYIKKILK